MIHPNDDIPLPPTKTLEQRIFEDTIRFINIQEEVRQERMTQPFIPDEDQRPFWLVESWRLFRDGKLQSPLEYLIALVFFSVVGCFVLFMFALTIQLIMYVGMKLGVG